MFRQGVMAHHTSTHVLHAVLKEVLGTHVNQAGSFVGPDRLRFDFSHYSSIGKQELDSIEQIINERIRRDDAVMTKEDVSYDEAIKDGATAIFEEKYGDRVRVVMIGDYSKELCGGTHVRASGEMGMVIDSVRECVFCRGEKDRGRKRPGGMELHERTGKYP